MRRSAREVDDIGSSKKYSDGFWKVYVHINKLNGKRYVGITSQKVEYRWNYGRAYSGNSYFSSALKKYGWENFEHLVLFDRLTEAEAKEKERELIARWQTTDRAHGYNITSGGESGSGFVPPDELRRRWSEVRTGTRRSDETKARMSKSSAFRRPEVIQKCAESKYKRVSAFTQDGKYICTYDSILQAADRLGLTDAQRKHITDCCRGSRKTAGGYQWNYA